MVIGFTGHRDCITEVAYLDKLRDKYQGATWLTGGAVGFDNQVEGYARENGITVVTIKPDYSAHGRRAPLVRNDEILNESTFLVACYDGRTGGGTYYTVRNARRNGIPVMIVPVVKIQE